MVDCSVTLPIIVELKTIPLFMDGCDDVGVNAQSGSAKKLIVNKQNARLPKMTDDSRLF